MLKVARVYSLMDVQMRRGGGMVASVFVSASSSSASDRCEAGLLGADESLSWVDSAEPRNKL
jgi:hypothetical protein